MKKKKTLHNNNINQKKKLEVWVNNATLPVPVEGWVLEPSALAPNL